MRFFGVRFITPQNDDEVEKPPLLQILTNRTLALLAVWWKTRHCGCHPEAKPKDLPERSLNPMRFFGVRFLTPQNDDEVEKPPLLRILTNRTLALLAVWWKSGDAAVILSRRRRISWNLGSMRRDSSRRFTSSE